MATPREIQARWAARDAKPATPEPIESDKPDGFILVDGAPMAVWLNGNDPHEIGLTTFARDTRDGKDKAAA